MRIQRRKPRDTTQTPAQRVTVRALTVRQPWAWAIIHAGKNIENRTWTNRHAIGMIAIHAGSGTDPLNELPRGVRKPKNEELIHGAIIGIVEIVGVVERHDSKWFRGPLGWLLRQPRPLAAPIHCGGRLGLWRLPRNVQDTIAQQFRDGRVRPSSKPRRSASGSYSARARLVTRALSEHTF